MLNKYHLIPSKYHITYQELYIFDKYHERTYLISLSNMYQVGSWQVKNMYQLNTKYMINIR